jgi:ABC-type branched-subunit amino acid transport system substrate-binding protein
LIILACAALFALAGTAQAQYSDGKIKIGILDDFSGQYCLAVPPATDCRSVVRTVKLAIGDFGGSINGTPIELIYADHQNKPDVGVSIANRWYDTEQVDVIVDVVNSAVALAVQGIARSKGKAVLFGEAGSAELTGKACAPYSAQWIYDTYQFGSSIGAAVPQLGKTWFIIAADYAFGKGLAAGVKANVEKAGGTVVGTVFHPFGTSDMSSFMLQAQASKAQVIALGNAGSDMNNAIKSAHEFGLIESGVKIVPLSLDLPIIKNTGGLEATQGMMMTLYIHTGGVVYADGAPRLWPGTKSPETRIFILPVGQAKFLGNWDVMGLRATGSIDYSIADIFVPEDFTHKQTTNVPRQGGNLYSLGIQGMGAICHSGFALGCGRRMLDELRALAGSETGRPSLLPQIGGGESFQEQFGLAEAKFRAVRALAHETWGDIEETLKRGDRLSTRQITLSRLTLNYITSAIAEVCTFAYKYAGGRALRAGTLQRCFRDMYAATQHVTTGPNILRECGKELLEIAPGKVWGPRGLVDPE